MFCKIEVKLYPFYLPPFSPFHPWNQSVCENSYHVLCEKVFVFFLLSCYDITRDSCVSLI